MKKRLFKISVMLFALFLLYSFIFTLICLSSSKECSVLSICHLLVLKVFYQ